MEVDDDVFFADLNRQISLLIMEDDDEGGPVITHYPSVSPQAFCRENHQVGHSSFSSQPNSRREIKGTGVFIPQSLSRPRRKNKQSSGKFSSSNTKLQRNSDDKNPRGLLPHASAFSSHDSFNPKRC